MIIIFSTIVLVISAIVGLLISRRIPLPKKKYVWILLLVLIVIAGYIGTNTAIFSIIGFAATLNYFLQGILLGMFAGFLMRSSGLTPK